MGSTGVHSGPSRTELLSVERTQQTHRTSMYMGPVEVGSDEVHERDEHVVDCACPGMHGGVDVVVDVKRQQRLA